MLIHSGTQANATAVPTLISAETLPIRERNHIAIVLPLSSVNEPWPRNRNRKNASNSVEKPLTVEANRQVPANATTANAVMPRKPQRSDAGPMVESGIAASSVPSMYANDNALSLSPNDSRIAGVNALTANVWPGLVQTCRSIATGIIT